MPRLPGDLSTLAQPIDDLCCDTGEQSLDALSVCHANQVTSGTATSNAADGAALGATSRVDPRSMRMTGGACRFLHFLRYTSLVSGHEHVNLHCQVPATCHESWTRIVGLSHSGCTAPSSLCGGGQCCRPPQGRKIQVGVSGGAAVEGQGLEKGGEGGGGGGRGGGGDSGSGGGRGDGGGGRGDSAGGGFGWKGWQDRVAFDPEFPFKVLVEQVRCPPISSGCRPAN